MTCWAHAMFGGRCEGRIDRAHIGFRKQTLKRAGLTPDQVWDPRVWRYVCRTHHERLDGWSFHLWKHQLPSSVIEYAKEHGLEHVLGHGRREAQCNFTNQGENMTGLLVVAYLAAIIVANLTTATWGPNWSIYNAFALVGFSMTTRDRLDDAWQQHRFRNMALLIVSGSALSYAASVWLAPGVIPSRWSSRSLWHPLRPS